MAKEIKRNSKGYIVDTIYDKEIIRKCASNTSKMSVLECCWYDVTQWRFFQNSLPILWESLWETFTNLLCFIFNLLFLILFPLALVMRATYSINEAKKESKRCDQDKGIRIARRYKEAKRRANDGDYEYVR